MKFKKLFSFILTFLFVFTSVVACFPGADVSASAIELADDDIKNANAVLKTLCPDFPLDSADKTTRAEFVAAVTMALNLPVDASVESGFSDVPKNHPYAKQIAYAAKMGIISNVALFYPDSNVTYSQAVKIVMAAAGYDKKAQYSGGFPIGYIKAAREAGIVTGQELGMDDSISHKLATNLIFEACCIDMMEQSSFGSNIDYTVTEGVNIFSKYHKVYIAEGVVEANANTGLDAPSQATAPGSVIVDRINYKADISDNLIGKRVRIFYKDDNSKTVLFAYEKGNSEAVYTSENGLSVSALAITAYLEETAKEVKHNLENDFKVIYNGKALLADDYASKINPSSGTVTLIDNDDNKKIDIIYIRDIEYGVIGSIDVTGEKIFDKYKMGGLLDLSISGIRYTITDSSGTNIDLDVLEVGNKIGYVMSSDKKYIEVIRCDDAIGGTYTSLTHDGMVELKGKEYKLSNYYVTNIKSADKLKLGTEVILYLSPDNQVIYIQEYTASLKYGFLVDVAQGSGLDSTVMVRIFTDDGVMLESSVSDKLILDGTPKTSKSEIKTYLDATVAKQAAYRVVKFSQNAEGRVNKLYTATDNTEGTAGLYKLPTDEARPVIYFNASEVSAPIPDEGEISYVRGNIRYSFGAFTPYFHASSTTKMIRIPVRPADFSSDENFRRITTVPGEVVRPIAYDVSYGAVASFVVIPTDSSAGAINQSVGSAIIESITDGLNEQGEVVKVLKLYNDGVWDKYYYQEGKTKITKENYGGSATSAQTELTISDFGPGDIIRISVDDKKVIGEMTMNFDVSEKNVPTEIVYQGGSSGKYVEYAHGYALSYSQSRLALAINKTIVEVNDVAGLVDTGNTYSGTLTRGKTVFVKFHRERSNGQILSAEVYSETGTSPIETYFTSGLNADYVVLRQYFREPTLNVIYVNIDE